jgi:hypothetical protein
VFRVNAESKGVKESHNVNADSKEFTVDSWQFTVRAPEERTEGAPSPVFLQKSAEALEKKGVVRCDGAKKCKRAQEKMVSDPPRRAGEWQVPGAERTEKLQSKGGREDERPLEARDKGPGIMSDVSTKVTTC